MVKFLSVCYIFFFVIITVISISNDFKTDGYPIWMIISEFVILPLGFASMLLYVFSCKLKGFSWLWKIVPFLIIAYYVTEWYFDFIIFKEPDFSPQMIGITTFVGLLLLSPLVYSSFKFGYSAD